MPIDCSEFVAVDAFQGSVVVKNDEECVATVGRHSPVEFEEDAEGLADPVRGEPSGEFAG